MNDQAKSISAALGNIKKIYLFSFFWMFLVIIPIIVPYFISLGLSMEQIFKLQAIFGITVAVLEVPSGYLSDLWGRKNTLIIGALVTAIGFTWLCFIKSYTSLILYEMLIALGLSLVSGTDLSILYDSLHLTGSDRKASAKAMGSIHFSQLSAESVASVLGGALATLSFAWPLAVHAIISWIPLFVALTLYEPKEAKKEEHDHWKNIKTILFEVFKRDSLLRLIFINLVVWGLSTFIAVWIFQRYWQEAKVDLTYFGLLWAGYNLLAGFVGKWAHFFEEKIGVTAVLLLLAIFPVIGYLGMGYKVGLLGIVFGLCFQFSRGLNQVILRDALNSRIDNKFRATINSLSSLFFRLGFALVGPAIGYAIDHSGLTQTLQLIGVCFLVLLIALMVPLVIKARKIKDRA